MTFILIRIVTTLYHILSIDSTMLTTNPLLDTTLSFMMIFIDITDPFHDRLERCAEAYITKQIY